MRVFVTGASGWIGSAVVAELLAAGHTVAASPAPSESADRHRAPPERRSTAAASTTSTACGPAPTAADAVVHLGFKHDFSDMPGAWRTERAVVDDASARARRLRPPVPAGVRASPGWHPGGSSTERDATPAPRTREHAGRRREPRARPRRERACARWPCGSRRPCTARATTASSPPWPGSRGARACPGTSATARPGGPPCTGSTPPAWSRLALEGAPAGSVVHAVGEEGVPTRADRRGHRAWARRPRRVRRPGRRRRATSAGSAGSSRSTSPRPAPSPVSCWAGSRRTPGCSRTSTPGTTPPGSRAPRRCGAARPGSSRRPRPA